MDPRPAEVPLSKFDNEINIDDLVVSARGPPKAWSLPEFDQQYLQSRKMAETFKFNIDIPSQVYSVIYTHPYFVTIH